jgi:hypothetical protein
MKKALQALIPIFLPCVIAAQPLHILPEEKPQLPPEASESWFEKAVINIAASEYNIQYSEANCGLRSQNRQNNFYVDLQGSGFTITPKTEGEAPVLISLKGIYANSALALKPDVKGYDYQNENEVVFWHRGFKEQYINTSAGLRQNFIVEENLNTKEIRVLLQVTGAVASASGFDQMRLRTPKGTIINYKDLKVWDATGRYLPARMQLLPDNQIALVVSNAQSAAYPITIDPLSATPATMLESNQNNARLGYSVSAAGDVNNDGYSDVIVGAPQYENGEVSEGAVFVYHGSSAGLNSTSALSIEGNLLGVNLGYSVGGAGDVNGDGYSDVIVSSPWFQNVQIQGGAAFIYYGSSNGIIDTNASSLYANQAGAQMGFSVACAGDVNGDGFSDVIVGAPYYDNMELDEGAVFVYLGSANGIISASPTLLESNQSAAAYGYSVATAGDINGDGYSDIIVGAPWFENGQVNEGSAFVYYGSFSGVNLASVSILECNQISAELGRSVSSAGDVNGDGYSDVIVGAVNFNNNYLEEGAVLVYQGSASGLGSTPNAQIFGNQASAWMGWSVACAGDINGDGFSEIVVGAHGFDNGQGGEGIAFVYSGSLIGISLSPAWEVESNQILAWLGWSVSGAGDINGDGYDDIIIGAQTYSNGEAQEGAAFVFHGSSFGLGSNNEGIFDDFYYPIVYSLHSNLILKMNGLSGEDVQISVLDMTGRLLQTTIQTNVELEISIPFVASAGVYVVLVENKKTGKVFSQKLVW